MTAAARDDVGADFQVQADVIDQAHQRFVAAVARVDVNHQVGRAQAHAQVEPAPACLGDHGGAVVLAVRPVGIARCLTAVAQGDQFVAGAHQELGVGKRRRIDRTVCGIICIRKLAHLCVLLILCARGFVHCGRFLLCLHVQSFYREFGAVGCRRIDGIICGVRRRRELAHLCALLILCVCGFIHRGRFLLLFHGSTLLLDITAGEHRGADTAHACAHRLALGVFAQRAHAVTHGLGSDTDEFRAAAVAAVEREGGVLEAQYLGRLLGGDERFVGELVQLGELSGIEPAGGVLVIFRHICGFHAGLSFGGTVSAT